MNRNAFADWGSDLNAADFACALAALSVLQAHEQLWPAPPNQEEVFARLQKIRTGKAYIPCACHLSSTAAADARMLSGAWLSLVRSWYPEPLRLALAYLDINFDYFWFLEQLSHPQVSAAGVWCHSEAFGGTRRWHWPLRIGMLGDSLSRDLETELRSMKTHPWTRTLTNFVDMSGQTAECDLLLLPHSQRAALAKVLSAPNRPRTLAALVFGPREGSYLDAKLKLWMLQQELSANAAVLAPVPEADRAEWYVDLVRELSHNQSLDIALRQVAGYRNTPAPLILAHSSWLLETELSHIARNLAGKMMDPAVSFAPMPVSDLELQVESYMGAAYSITTSLGKIGHILTREVENYEFARESDEASQIARLVREVGPLLRHVPPEVQPRRVQVRVFLQPSNQQAAVPTPLERAFAANASHRIECRIGMDIEGWLSSSEIFPQEQLPYSAKGHVLHVFLTEPNLLTEPRVETILLPPTGNSQSCAFHFRTRPESTRVEARLTIVYRNRVLQTTTIEGDVVKNPSYAPRGMHILIRPEVVVSPGMADLDAQSDYAAALLFNKTGDGRATVTRIVEDDAEFVTIDDQKMFATRISDRLNECDWADPDFSALDADGTVSLLCELARNGSLLYSNIVKRQFTSQTLAQAPRIQVIAARPEARFPVEYFYEYPSPAANATLCERAAEALSATSGKCVDCPHKIKTAERICPAGFWGLNRIIEWHLYRPEARREMTNADFVLQQEKMHFKKLLVPLRAAVTSASERVDKGVAGSFDTVLAAFKTAVPADKLGSPRSWDEWKRSVGELSPSLLMLIPHIDEDQQHFQTLEINGDHLAVDHIVEDFVRNPQKPTFPIVFLLGCETGVSEITFMGFLSKFCEHKPAVVVSTSCRILGRQAAMLASEFIQALQEAHGSETTFGDIMLTVRRRMLGKGLPMVLAVSSYGDADWRLT
jgi:hypothetical protein